jgi:hypothetical protein
MTTNTSATGGYLTPTSTSLEGKALNDFLHDLVCGITGLDGKMVRQRWQATDVPNLPQRGEAWCAIGIKNRPRKGTFPQVIHNGAGDGTDVLTSHETLEILASFYDTGTNGRADELGALLRDGLGISQNREQLLLNGMGVYEIGELLTVPALVKTVWQNRVDLEFKINRAVDRVYPVENVESLDGVIKTDVGLSKSLGG